MPRILLKTKVRPTGTEVDLAQLADKITNSLKDNIKLEKYTKEPLAFGLYFLNAEFSLDDKEGQMEALENTVNSIDGVSGFEVVGMSRASVDVK